MNLTLEKEVACTSETSAALPISMWKHNPGTEVISNSTVKA
jgi:hypothetical protein